MADKKLTKKERRALKKQEKMIAQAQNARKKVMRRLIFWAIVVLVIAGAVFGAVMLALKPQSGGRAGLVAEVGLDEHIAGNQNAAVTLIEYSDFQCPACAQYYPLVKDLVGEFGNEIQFAYRHFPLTQIHSNAELAARASEAAGRQGMFWEMHNMIFEGQSRWAESNKAEDIFINYSNNLGLNLEQFKNDLNSTEIKDRVTKDIRSGYAAKVNSTPTFFLNGQRIQPRNYNEFKNFILKALEEQAAPSNDS